MTYGTALGVLSAIAYSGANMALRQVAFRDDPDWAIWISCLKAGPAALTAWVLIGYRSWRGLPALPPRRLIVPLLLTGVVMQFAGNVSFQWALSQGGLTLTVPLTFATLILSGAWLGRLFLAEPISLRSAAAMGVLILSIVVLSVGAEGRSGNTAAEASTVRVALALLTAGLAGIGYGACGVVIRSVVTRDVSLSATLVLLSTTGVVLLGLTSLLRLGPEQLLQTSSSDFRVMLAAGTLNAIAFFSVGGALKHISVLRTNLLNASQAALCGLGGVLWFSEVVNVWLVAGILLTMVGLLLMGSSKETVTSPDD